MPNTSAAYDPVRPLNTVRSSGTRVPLEGARYYPNRSLGRALQLKRSNSALLSSVIGTLVSHAR